MEKKFAHKIFEGFSIQRWNDLIRPFEIIEMDKAAEKMVLAYIIGKYEEKNYVSYINCFYNFINVLYWNKNVKSS